MQSYRELFIGGEWVRPTGQATIDVVSSSTEALLGQVPDGTPADVDRAVAAARTVFDTGDWGRRSPHERGEVLTRLSVAILARGQTIADTISAENGCPTSISLVGQVLAATMVLDSYARLAGEYPWDETRAGLMGNKVRVRQVPVGVAAGVMPWNAPLFITAMKLGPAMLAGCPIVLKPAPEAALDSYLLAEAAIDAGVPAGVINIVPAGRETSEYLIGHPGVDKVSFTGSTAAGQRIGEICGRQIKRLTLELGGKSAAIVLDDVVLSDPLVQELVWSGMMMNGQVCGAQSRVLVPRGRYDEVVDAMATAAAALVVGDALDESTQIGPLVTERQRSRVEGYLESGRAAGARAVVGGGRPKGLDRGWFVEPTIFADVDNSMRIAREEIFGPVVSLIPYDGDNEAIRIANDSDFGLCGSVWTSDPRRGEEMAAQVRTGAVTINGSMILDINSPFGGFKKSGIGRELGPEGISAYTEFQSILLPS